MSINSLYLFELAVSHVQSFTKYDDYNISARFCDVFTMRLKDPNKAIEEVFKKSKVTIKEWPTKFIMPTKSVLVEIDNETLLSKMKTKPIELCVYSRKDPRLFGLVEIPWSFVHTQYVNSLINNENLPPAVVTDTYKAFDENTSKRVASVTLKIKVTQMTGKGTNQRHHRNNEKINQGSASNTLHSTKNLEETITGKTVYTGNERKRKDQSTKLNSRIKIESDNAQKKKAVSVIIPTNATAGFLNSNTVSAANGVHYNQPETANTDVRSCGLNGDYHLRSKAYTNGDQSENTLCGVTSRKRRLTSSIKSVTELHNTKLVPVSKHWSTTSLEIKQRMDTLNYIFGNGNGPFGNQVYCVGYFTVQSDPSSDAKSGPEYKFQPCGDPCNEEGQMSTNPCARQTCDSSNKKLYEMDICGPKCRFSIKDNPCFENVCSLDIPKDAGPKVKTLKCDNVLCEDRRRFMLMENPELPTLIKLDNRSVKECCIEQQVNVSAKMTHGDDPCLCTCDCTFGFVTQTTYCGVCGGYEVPGDEIIGKEGAEPFPCPIYHNLVKKGKGKKADETGSERPRGKRPPGSATADDKSIASSGKSTKKQLDERFKFNYGYKAPTIGHSNCVSPCTGDYSNVPKYMGWLWTADNIPGLKRRPGWRPGAANKHVVRMLKIARYPDTVLNKRRRADSKKKRDPKRPLLVVEKKDGEYFVNMETMRQYNKARLLNQPAFEDKDPIVYKVGRTDEENMERAKRKARARRRLMREQRAFIQSAFHDMCKDICMKTYQQALALLPFAEDPLCPCFPIEPPPDKTDDSHSCSCTDSERDSGSATDEDEWIVEFTPPNAYYDPQDKTKRINRNDFGTQYSYLDYRVNLLDRFGNPVPRYFTGPTGKKECSDLGGFWGPGKQWLEINVDGVVGPDGRWAPNSFIGPCGEPVEAEFGKFETSNGVLLLVGVDGFVDFQGKWHFYPQNKNPGHGDSKQKNKPAVQQNIAEWLSAGGCKAKEEIEKQKKRAYAYGVQNVPSENAWGCFGTASIKDLSKRGIVGHGRDRKLLLSTLEKMMAEGENVEIPQINTVPRLGRPRKHATVPRISNASASKHGKQSSGLGISAISDQGNKVRLKIRDTKSLRLKQRLKVLDDEGISLSSYHVPCFRSFLNTQEERQLITEHILKHNAQVMADMGIQAISLGWKPGAITNRLLRKLNKAKQSTNPVSNHRPLKKAKKRVEEKPALIVARRNGEYVIEMQVYNKQDEHCKPMIYKISSANREEKIQKRERYTQRLIDQARDEIFADELNRPDVCETTCTRAYKQAIGLCPFAPEPGQEECACDDDAHNDSDYGHQTDSTDTGSLDLEWELQFTPPNICNRSNPPSCTNIM